MWSRRHCIRCSTTCGPIALQHSERRHLRCDCCAGAVVVGDDAGVSGAAVGVAAVDYDVRSCDRDAAMPPGSWTAMCPLHWTRHLDRTLMSVMWTQLWAAATCATQADW